MASRRLVQCAVLVTALALASTAHLEWLEIPAYDPTLLKLPEPPSSSGLRFRGLMQSFGFNLQERTTFCTIDYQSEDGIPAERLVIFYRTRSQAREEREKLAARSRVLARRASWDSYGKRMEERVVLAANPARRHSRPAVVWASGDMLYILESESLFHVLAFEQWGFPPKQQPTAAAQLSTTP